MDLSRSADPGSRGWEGLALIFFCFASPEGGHVHTYTQSLMSWFPMCFVMSASLWGLEAQGTLCRSCMQSPLVLAAAALDQTSWVKSPKSTIGELRRKGMESIN